MPCILNKIAFWSKLRCPPLSIADTFLSIYSNKELFYLLKTDGTFSDLLSQREEKPKMTVGPLHCWPQLMHPSAAFFLEQVCTASHSFCVRRLLSAARGSSLHHLTCKLEIFLNLTWQQKSWQGKAAQQPHLVPCTSDYAQCPASASSARASLTLHTLQAQHKLTLLFMYHFFQVHLSKAERIRTGEEVTCATPAQTLQHAVPASAAQESSPTSSTGNWQY